MAVLNLTDVNFEQEVIKSEIPVMVDFYAVWCGPCQMAAPIIEELSEVYTGKVKIGKINVDESPKAAQQYGVMSIPTVVMFKDGKEAQRQVGFAGKEGYAKLINSLLGS